MNNKFLITGLYRSGTTLLDKLLHTHPALVVASQPFPSLFIYTKKKFLDQKGINKRYPINSLFMEDEYNLSEFILFIQNHYYGQEDRDIIIHNLSHYEGINTPEFVEYCIKNNVLKNDQNNQFSTLYDSLVQLLPPYLQKPDPSMIGTKEIICEEFIPWFLSTGKKVVHILRDPRDIAASLSTDKNGKYMGASRPLLYTLRMWRKSVAFKLAFSDHPNYFYVRYEDLVSDPLPILNQLADFLRVSSFSMSLFDQGIYDQMGNRWKGNSSFGNYNFISTSSVGKYQLHLPPNIVQYIDLLCAPEMKFLGYDGYPSPIKNIDLIDEIKIIENVGNPRFKHDFSTSTDNLLFEKQRLRKLSEPLSNNEARFWFVFEEAYKKLSKTFFQQ